MSGNLWGDADGYHEGPHYHIGRYVIVFLLVIISILFVLYIPEYKETPQELSLRDWYSNRLLVKICYNYKIYKWHDVYYLENHEKVSGPEICQ